MRIKIFMVICILFVSGSFIGCGGSSDGSADVTQTGYFVDGPVEGLSYSTATQSGQTGGDGSFYYEQGETVDFYVGDILIGQAAGASTISPFDLVGITPPQTGVEIRRALNSFGHNGSALEQVANIAAFLQTLDEDGDLTNGIQIPYQIHTLAAGATIDFNQSWSSFPKDFSLRKLVANGRGAGLWGGNRQIRHPAYALGALYAGLGITPMNYVPAVRNIDGNADGTVDKRYTYTYDSNGNKTMYEYDSNADGKAEMREIYTFDVNGNPTMFEYDSDADGTVDSRSTFTYDINDDKTKDEHDYDADGTVDSRRTYTYDSNGNKTMEYDSDVDGTVDSRTTHTYAANGSSTMEEVDDNADGMVDKRHSYSYDANGNQIMYEYDSNADGTVDSRSTFTYDANGNQTMYEVDDNADGTVDKRYTYSYDANGNQIMYEVDDNADGTVDSRTTFTYDTNGDQAMEEVDDNADGTVDERTTYTNQFVNGWMYYYIRY